jgi:hypothetical protein
MIAIIKDGENRYRIVDGKGAELGWIRGRALRFDGFRTDDAVMDAALRAWRALQSALRHEEVQARRHAPRLGRLRLVHDGAYEWISDGQIPVARLFRPPADAGPEATFAIELLLPSYASEALVMTAAREIAEAVRQHAAVTAHVPPDAA